MHARWGMSVAMTATMALAFGTSVTIDGRANAADGEPRGDAATTALRERIRAEAGRLRAELDAAQASESGDQLLARRATVLAALTPAFLLAEAAAAVARDGAPGTRQDPGPGPELLAAWRIEHRDGAPISRWSPGDGAARVRAALRAWAATETRAVAWAATTHGARFTGADAPPTIAWSASAWGAPCTVHARAWWHEPAGDHAAIDFPLSPDGLDLRWDPDGVRLAQDGGASHRERWAAEPAAFINPPDLYSLEDGLRCFRAADAMRVAADGADVGDADTAGAVVTHVISRPDGRRLRLERWQFDGHALRSLVIEQDAALLVHGSPFGYDIVSEVDGDVIERTPHRPTATLTAFPGGLRIALSFRRPDAARDVAPAAVLDDPGASVPERAVFTDADGIVAVVEIAGVAIVDGMPAPDDAANAGHAAERLLPGVGCMAASAGARAEATSALQRAVDLDDPTAAHGAAVTIAALQAADGVSAGMAAMAFERACLRALHAGRTRAAEAIARGPWLDAWRGCDQHEQGEAIMRIRQAHATHALAWLGEALPAEPGRGVPEGTMCEASTLPTRSQALLDGVRAALRGSRGVARGMAEQAAQAVCAALAAAGGEITRDDGHAASLSGAARAWLDAGRAGLDRDEDDPSAREDATRAFAAHVIRAAMVGPAGAAATGTARNALLRYADAAREVVAALGAEAGWTRAAIDEEAAVARDRVRALAGLVGNPFVPEWMSVDGVAIEGTPSVRAMRDELASTPTLAAAARRERTRAAIVATVAPAELVDARQRAGRRAIARDVADAAVRAFDSWVRQSQGEMRRTIENGQGPDGSPKRPPSGPSAHLPCDGHPAGPFPQPEGRASRVPAEAAQPDRRCDCPIRDAGMQAVEPGSSRMRASTARAGTAVRAVRAPRAGCAGLAGAFSALPDRVRPWPRASAGSRGRSAPIPPPGCRHWRARWRRGGARTCRG